MGIEGARGFTASAVSCGQEEAERLRQLELEARRSAGLWVFGVGGYGCRVSNLGFRFQGFEFSIQGFEFRQGLSTCHCLR